MRAYREASGSAALLGVFIATKRSFQTAKIGDQSAGLANLAISESRKDGSGLLVVEVGCVSETAWPSKVCGTKRCYYDQ